MKYRLLVAMVGALCFVSCESPDGTYGPPSGAYGPRAACERFTSCATCTPVLGCGWCQSGDKGLCTSEPDRCARAASFSWTWELAFCPAAPDGGAGGWIAVSPNDAAASEASTEAAVRGDSGNGGNGDGEAGDGEAGDGEAGDRAPDATPHE